MHQRAGLRARAYGLDALGYLGIAAATVPLGVWAQRQGWGASERFVLSISAVPPVLAAVWAAAQESGRHQATWGKRRYGLVVVTPDGSSVGFGRALVRNLIKITLPWQLGHAFAVKAAFGALDDPDPGTIALLIATYALPVTLFGGAALPAERGLPDLLAATAVRCR